MEWLKLNTLLPGSSYTNWKGWQESKFLNFTLREKEYFEAQILPFVNNGIGFSNVIEIGFGNGSFLGWCKSINLDIIGVEVIPELNKRAIEAGVPSFDSIYSSDLSEFVSSIDLIVAFDVLEHISDSELPVFFDRVKQLLKNEGKFVFRVPNGDSPFGLPYQNGDLTHKTSIGRNKIQQLANQAGFSIEKIEAPAKSETKAISLGRNLFEKLIANLYFEGNRYVFSPNIVAVLTSQK